MVMEMKHEFIDGNSFLELITQYDKQYLESQQGTALMSCYDRLMDSVCKCYGWD